MTDVWPALTSAFELITQDDGYLREIVALSLRVSLTAVVIATLLGLPIGAMAALFRFPGRKVLVVFLNVLMGLPPVVVGLVVYLLLSRSGPFGNYNHWEFHP